MSSYFGGNNDKSSEIDEEEPYAGKLYDMILIKNKVFKHSNHQHVVILFIVRYAINRTKKQTSTICVLPFIFGGHESILEWCAGRKNICLEREYFLPYFKADYHMN